MADETTAVKPKNQSALQVPKFAAGIVDRTAAKLDEKGKHVIAAAVMAFATLPTESQLDLVKAAKVKYAESVEATS